MKVWRDLKNKIFKKRKQKMKKNIVYIFLLGIILGIILIFIFEVWMKRNFYFFPYDNSIEKINHYGNPIKKIKINNQVIIVEEVASPEKRAKGLSGREDKDICSDCGMLFVFPDSGKYYFVMREMRFPLDFIFIRGEEVVDTFENIAPNFQGLITSDKKADKVLEIKAGKNREWGIKKGDKVLFLN